MCREPLDRHFRAEFEELITPAEASAYLRVHPKTIIRLARQKAIPALRMTLSKDLADAFIDWRRQCLYRADDDWIFASPDKHGLQPLWLDQILKNYVRPVAREAGISKNIGWHTFRRSISSLLSDAGEPIKVVSELLRHANISITADLYQQAGADAKRAAQDRMKKLFAAA